MREAGGENMILEVRMSATDGVPGGLQVGDVADFFKLTEAGTAGRHRPRVQRLKWEGQPHRHLF